MSDTEILNMKAPVVNKARGRPRVNRYCCGDGKKGISTKKKVTISTKSTMKKQMENSESSGSRKRAVIVNDNIGDNIAANPTNASCFAPKNNDLPKQSNFCSSCRTTGYNITTCGRGQKAPKKSARTKKALSMQTNQLHYVFYPLELLEYFLVWSSRHS
uniref:Uncharacterized protein n=1 Tax=Arundo donax TaxID=35708 RepID=A0A0A9DFL6_ARUDO